MFGKKQEEKDLTNEELLQEQVYKFPWFLMFTDIETGLMAKIFPYIACVAFAIIIILVAVK